MLIQVVGLPCSGKSTTLKNLQKIFAFAHIDKQKPHTLAQINEIVDKNAQSHCVIESACGFSDLESIVILLKVSKAIHSKNKRARNYVSNEKDDNQISYQIIPAHFTVYSTKELKKILTILLRT